MDYELIVSDAALETVSKYRQDLLRGVASMAMHAVESADANEYWRIPVTDQHDPITATHLASLMDEHGVEVRVSGDKKSYLIPAAQPYGRFVEEMMGVQRYPEVHPAPGSGILEPYDVAAWSLPLMMGVRVEKVRLDAGEQQSAAPVTSVPWPSGGLEGKGAYYSISANKNNVAALINAVQKSGEQVSITQRSGQAPEVIFRAGGSLATNAEKLHLMLKARPDLPSQAVALKPVRLALYKPYVASLDEGWTRFVLEQYGFPVKNIVNKDIKA